MDVEGNLLVTMHVRGINQNEAIKMVTVSYTHLDVYKRQEYGLEQVYNVIDSRYRSGKPLIVTTNLTLDLSLIHI